MEESTETLVSNAAGELAILPSFDSSLPWRINRTPYRVLLAEFLLVRTRTDIVASHFERIHGHFPDLETLAQASIEAVEGTLAPLGLRKRVAYLVEAARFILRDLGGEIPADPEQLLRIPGIGPYTAAAIAALAFGCSVVPADVNVYRFLSRLTGLEMAHKTKGSAELRALLPMLSPQTGGPSIEILLDFTRLVCRPRNPLCQECVLSDQCRYPTQIDLTGGER